MYSENAGPGTNCRAPLFRAPYSAHRVPCQPPMNAWRISWPPPVRPETPARGAASQATLPRLVAAERLVWPRIPDLAMRYPGALPTQPEGLLGPAAYSPVAARRGAPLAPSSAVSVSLVTGPAGSLQAIHAVAGRDLQLGNSGWSGRGVLKGPDQGSGVGVRFR